MLSEEVKRYRELSGDNNPNTPISRIGGYLDGYERALEQEPTATLDKIRAEIEDFVYPDGRSDYLLGFNFGLMRAAQVINKYRAEGSEKE